MLRDDNDELEFFLQKSSVDRRSYRHISSEVNPDLTSYPVNKQTSIS